MLTCDWLWWGDIGGDIGGDMGGDKRGHSGA